MNFKLAKFIYLALMIKQEGNVRSECNTHKFFSNPVQERNNFLNYTVYSNSYELDKQFIKLFITRTAQLHQYSTYYVHT